MEKPRKMPKYPPKAKPRNSNGAPTKLTDEVFEKIIQALQRGNYFEVACQLGGIHPSTAYEWLKKANKEGPDGFYRKFSDAVQKAQAEAEDRDLSAIYLAAHGAPALYDNSGNKIRDEVPRQWTAAAWRLERKFPKKWGRLDRHEVTGKDGGPLSFVDFIRKLEEEDEEQ